MDLELQFVHLARFLAADDRENVSAILRRTLATVGRVRPDLARKAAAARALVDSGAAVRSAAPLPLPVDADSRLELLRREVVATIDPAPVWPASVESQLTSVREEYLRREELFDAGLIPTRSLLFVGPPGVGKTLAAHWLASKLDIPLLTLDLAAVMSSFLGRTGNNLRIVLDYSKRSPAVLLLDEFDAIAKRRDDSTEIGELKRLVTVLLQAIDEWPSQGLLLAATNHPGLLDPAVWRRFDRIVEFPLPSVREIELTLEATLAGNGIGDSGLLSSLATVLDGKSFADIIRLLNTSRREALLAGKGTGFAFETLVKQQCRGASLRSKLKIAKRLLGEGRSQREVSSFTGLARDTLRKYLSDRGKNRKEGF